MIQAARTGGAPAPKTVLIVEDQLEIRAIHTAYLQHHGYRVLGVGDGNDAVRVARAQHPDIVLMDVSIPGMDGIDATAALKGDPATRDIPVVIVTALPYGSVGPRARRAGCDGWLAKPCDPRRVLLEVQGHVGAAPPLH